MSNRNFWCRSALILLLIPLGLIVYLLARLPEFTNLNVGHEDDRALLTVYVGHVEDELLTCGLLSFATGKTTYFRSSSFPDFSQGGLYWCEKRGGRMLVKGRDLDSGRETELGSFDGGLFERPICVSAAGRVAMASKQNELCVVDFKTGGMATSPLPELKPSNFHFWLIRWLESPQRLMAYEVSNGRTKGQDRVVLFSYENGNLAKLAEWKSSSLPNESTGNLFSFTIDYVLEVRRISDGSLLESQPLAKTLNLPQPASAWPRSVWMAEVESDVVHFFVRPNRQIAYDYTRQQIRQDQSIPKARGWYPSRGDALSITDNVLEIGSASAGKRTRRIVFPTTIHYAYKRGSDQICVILNDDSVHLYHLATGKRIQSYRSRAWQLPTFVALVLGFTAWAFLWVRQSVRVETRPLGDIVVTHGVLMAALLMWVFLPGSLREPSRLVYHYLEALGASWLFILMLWFIFGSARWSIKVIAPLSGLVGILLIAIFVFRGSRQAITELLVSSLALMTTVGIILGLARRWGWQLRNVRLPGHEDPTENLESRVPLRDLFVITLAIGVLLAIVRSLPARIFDTQPAEMLALLVLTIALVAVAGAWAALSSRPWWTRMIVVLFLVLGAGSVHSLLYSQFYNWSAWIWQQRFAALVCAFTCSSLLIYRVRGWRCVLERSANIELGSRNVTDAMTAHS